MQSIGERLKREREKQGVTLDEVCVSTKIAVRFLSAIEEEHFEKLPGGIFNKGFVRAYAQHLGLNEEEAVADYLKAAGLEPTVPLNTTPPGEEKISKPAIPEVSAATLLKEQEAKRPEPQPVEVKKPVPNIETKAAMVETKPPKHKGKAARVQARQEKKEEKEKKIKRPEPAHQPAPQAEAGNEHWFPWGKVAFALLLIAFGFAMWGSFHRDTEEHTSQPIAQPAVNQSVVTPVPPALQNVSTAAAVPASAAPLDSATVPASTEGQPTAASQELSTSADGSFLVVVQAREDSWVSIIADGKEVMKDVLGAPAQKAIEAHKEVVIKAGNIGALDFVFNGKKLPSQGEYDEVKTLTFDPNGLQSQPVKTAGL